MREPGSPGRLGLEEADRLFEAARRLPPAERTGYVRRTAETPDLAREVLSLLDHADAADAFFDGLGDRLRTRFPGHDAGTRPGDAPSPPPEPEFPPGHLVGRYRILEAMGAGGMGRIYRAHDQTLGREVALKFLPEHLAYDPSARRRFFQEARATAALDHPNVCTIHEVGEAADGRPFIAMALYRGETLKERIVRGPLPLDEAVACGRAIAAGLTAAHGQGIVHRDVKPGNVMFAANDVVKLLDFGVAKREEVTATGPGMVPGTLAYMSPEQVRGLDVDLRVDLWALGVVLYEMLTGVRPFHGEGDLALLRAIVHAEPEGVQALRPETPEALARVVERLLQKDRDRRFRSAKEVEKALAGSLDGTLPGTRRWTGEGWGGRVRRPGWLGPWARAPAATVALAAVGALIWWSPDTRAGGSDPGPASPRALLDAAPEPGGPELVTVAVLPFASPGDADDAFLAAGMAEALRDLLARTRGLHVLENSSAFAVEDRAGGLRAVADSLGVAYLVDGHVQRRRSRLHLQVRLVDRRDGSVRWSRTYDREFRDVFAVQDEIANAVALELGIQLLPHPATEAVRPPTENLAAYELVLRGSDRALVRTDSTAREGLEYFRQAVALDSTYAAAWAGLARMTYRVRAATVRDTQDWGVGLDEVLAEVEQAALRALSLDGTLPDAHRILGVARMAALDFAGAEAHLGRALAADPSRSQTHEVLVALYIWTGRPTEALTAAQAAVAWDPFSPSAPAEMARALAVNDRCDEALMWLGRIADLDPPLARAAPLAAQCYARMGMWQEAVAAMSSVVRARGPRARGYLAHVLALAGRREEALDILKSLLDGWEKGQHGAFPVALVYAGLGDLDQAFAWLERALDDRSVPVSSGSAPSLMEPLFDDLRRDFRFEPVADRLGIPYRESRQGAALPF